MSDTNTTANMSNVYAFAATVETADRIAKEANAQRVTRKGLFVPGSFAVAMIEGRCPAVIGTLAPPRYVLVGRLPGEYYSVYHRASVPGWTVNDCSATVYADQHAAEAAAARLDPEWSWEVIRK